MASAIAEMFFRAVSKGKRTIDSVPEHWRKEVQTLLDAANRKEE